VFVERLWKSVKYERVYLHAYDSVIEARQSIREEEKGTGYFSVGMRERNVVLEWTYE
jgi:hypothetical protein